MVRRTRFDLVLDTSHFTPLQLQTRTLLQVSFNALSRWLKEHLVAFARLIQDHSLSVVIMGAGVRYGEPLGFFDGDSVQVDAGCRLVRDASRIVLDVSFSAAGREVANVTILLCPVRIDDPASLAASPTKVGGDVLGRFAAGEVQPGSPERALPPIVRAIESEGALLARAVSSFVVHRHLCEVADQWAFIEVPALVGAGREAMARDGAAAEVSASLGRPLRAFDMELLRPYFWFQGGQVESRAFRWNGTLAVVHRLLSSVAGDELHGVVVERF